MTVALPQKLGHSTAKKRKKYSKIKKDSNTLRGFNGTDQAKKQVKSKSDKYCC